MLYNDFNQMHAFLIDCTIRFKPQYFCIYVKLTGNYIGKERFWTVTESRLHGNESSICQGLHAWRNFILNYTQGKRDGTATAIVKLTAIFFKSMI